MAKKTDSFTSSEMFSVSLGDSEDDDFSEFELRHGKENIDTTYMTSVIKRGKHGSDMHLLTKEDLLKDGRMGDYFSKEPMPTHKSTKLDITFFTPWGEKVTNKAQCHHEYEKAFPSTAKKPKKQPKQEAASEESEPVAGPSEVKKPRKAYVRDEDEASTVISDLDSNLAVSRKSSVRSKITKERDRKSLETASDKDALVQPLVHKL
ncbi:hypothetical protein ABW21_db0202949 [Orbilia brochopaga]|nr:hypothetical protein ABW21_db0202949 [Drechslerella brochopaga]